MKIIILDILKIQTTNKSLNYQFRIKTNHLDKFSDNFCKTLPKTHHIFVVIPKFPIFQPNY